MKKVLFAKYNRMRKEEYQISTVIYEEDNRKHVEKAALNSKARKHISDFVNRYEKLNNVYKNISLIKPQISENKMIAGFEFINGLSLDGILRSAMNSRQHLLETIKKYIDLMFEINEENICCFEATKEFVDVFGATDKYNFENCKAINVANVDMILDNIMMVDGRLICLDYEWVYEFPIPLDFLKFRVLFYFYNKYKDKLSILFSFDELINEFGINRENSEVFMEFENNFQKFVHGKNHEFRYTDHYKQENVNFLELQRKNERRIARLLQVQDENQKKLAELERIIQDKERHIVNIQPGYEAWVKMTNNPFIKFARLSKRGVKKISHKVGSLFHYRKMVFPKNDTPKVSIIIPVFNQFNFTYNCLKSIYENSKDVSYEVIVADDVSTDFTKNLDVLVKNVNIIRNENNLRFLLNCNNAAGFAKGEYILFLNNDTEVKENWLSSLVELIESDEKIGMVGSKLVYPDGRLQEAGGIIWKDASAWNYGNGQNPDLPEFNYVREVDYISGASIMIRKNLWEEIGGFDERYVPAYCEDSDLAFEVRNKGYKVMYQPKSVVVHYEGVSNGTDVNTGIKSYQVQNNKKLYEKWKEELANHFENGQNVFRACERNYDKKVILVIDHYVPTFDKDAGSKTTFQYIKLFLNKGYVVKFLGDNYGHEEPYTSVLEQLGVEVLYGDWFRDNIFTWIKENMDNIHLVYLNRPHIAEKYIDFIKDETNIKVIYYGHDLHFVRMNREYELNKDEKIKEEAEVWKEKELSIMGKADISYYPSFVEVDEIHKVDENIRVKDITAYVYDKTQIDNKFNANERNGLLFVGGFSHAPNVDAIIWFCKEIFPIIREKIDIDLYIVGSNAPEEVKNLKAPGIVFKGFVSDDELENLYRNTRIVVAPLRYGAGVKGKIIEALNYGVPIVTTSIGAEGINDIDKIINVTDEPSDFAKAVMDIYNDESLLERMSYDEQKYIQDNFSVDAVWNKIAEDFN